MKFSILKLVCVAVIFAANPAAFTTTWHVNGVSGKDSKQLQVTHDRLQDHRPCYRAR